MKRLLDWLYCWPTTSDATYQALDCQIKHILPRRAYLITKVAGITFGVVWLAAVIYLLSIP